MKIKYIYLASALSVTVASVLMGAVFFKKSVQHFSEYPLSINSNDFGIYIYDSEQNLIGNIGNKNREFLSIDRLNPLVSQAFISIEDRYFYDHSGVSARSIMRAALSNLKAGRVVQGGSTITQQFARNILNIFEKSGSRKLKEIMFALYIEKTISKKEILEGYLNTIYFGAGYYGLEAASRGYFKKSAQDLRLSEIALLAAVIKAPSAYNLHSQKGMRRAIKRRRLILKAMFQEGFIDRAQAKVALNQYHRASKNKSYVTEMGFGIDRIRQEIKQTGILINKSSLRISSSLDSKKQLAVNKILRSLDLGKNSQIALLSINKTNARMNYLSGSSDYLESQFNRVFKTRRPIARLAPQIVKFLMLESKLISSRKVAASKSLFDTAQMVHAIGFGTVVSMLKEKSWKAPIEDLSFLFGKDLMSLKEIAEIVGSIYTGRKPSFDLVDHDQLAGLSRLGHHDDSGAALSFEFIHSLKGKGFTGSAPYWISLGSDKRNSWLLVDLGSDLVFAWYGIDAGAGSLKKREMRKVLSGLYRKLDSSPTLHDVRDLSDSLRAKFYWQESLSSREHDVFLPQNEVASTSSKGILKGPM